MFFVGSIQGGRLHLKARGQFDAFVATLEGKTVRLELDPYDHQTGAQRRYFHAMCRLVSRRCEDHTIEEVKAVAKHKTLPAHFDQNGEPHLGQSRNCTREEYSQLIEGLIQYAAEELDLVIPDPRPKHEVDFDEIRAPLGATTKSLQNQQVK